MRTFHRNTGLPSIGGLLLVAVLFAACGADTNDQTVAVNLSLIVDGRQAQHRSAPSKFFAWIERWFPDASPAWAQSVTEIAKIDLEISGPGIVPPITRSQTLANPQPGDEIHFNNIPVPIGPNRTITVSAFNTASQKIFGGSKVVNLTAGPPVDVAIELKRLFTVTVQKDGAGSGIVTSTPAGIDCGATCSNQFQEGTTVALNAAADPGSSFEGWSGGGCSGRGSCTLDSTATVTANFRVAPNSNRLTVVKAGTGTGTVTSNPSGISCGTACAADFAFTTIITLTAVPAEGSTFASWSVAGCGGTAPSCTFGMTEDTTIIATFSAITPVPMSTLTVQKNGSGSGTVTSAPSGINCGNDCSGPFPTGDTVRLTASPASGSTFVEWTGACSGTGECLVTMTTNQTVSARFDLVPEFVRLTVTKSGQGNGTVTSAPGGIDCGQVCEATFLKDSDVTLTASPDLISAFRGWKGSGCGNEVTCTIRMDNDKRVEAQFDLLFGP